MSAQTTLTFFGVAGVILAYAVARLSAAVRPIRVPVRVREQRRPPHHRQTPHR